jgi:cell division protein FtsZ
MALDFHIEENETAKIKVVGVGGGGGNALDNMIRSQLQGVTFIAANTDAQALSRSLAEHKIQIGVKASKGLGAGADPRVGCEAANENIDQIKALLADADMVFVTAGMGGGTGTGAAPVIAQAAKEMNILTVGVVTKPFFFEGKVRLQTAENGIDEFRKYVDSLITIPNDRLLQLAAKKASFIDMLKKADEVLYYAVKSISDLILVPGLINLDFADVRTVMSESGLAMMGTGIASGESRAREAALKAITSPLLEGVSIDGARKVLMNITCGSDLGIDEVAEAAGIVNEAAHDEVHVIFGTVCDDNVGDEMRITVIATGIDTVLKRKDDPIDKISMLKGGNRAGMAGGSGPGVPGRRPQGAGGAPEYNRRPQGLDSVSEDLRRAVVRTDGETVNRNVPAYLRGEQQKVYTGAQTRQASHNPGEEDFIFDEADFEMPSFIRKQAN